MNEALQRIGRLVPLRWRARRIWEQIQLARPRVNRAPEWITVADRPSVGSLVSAGDLAPIGELEEYASAGHTDKIFGSLLPTLLSADIRMANLETVLTRSSTPQGELGSFLKAAPEAVSLLERARIDVVTVANNHCLDFGVRGLHDSVSLLRARGIEVAGTAAGFHAPTKPIFVERKGVQFGVLAYCDDFVPPHERNPTIVPAIAEEHRMLGEVSSLRERCDIVVVQLHWGYEFQLYPMLYHRDLARRVAEAGADIVVCHHAHVPMGVEKWKRSIIAHGVGNFVFWSPKYFRQGHPLCKLGLLLEVEFDRAGVTRARALPFRIELGGTARELRREEFLHARAIFAVLGDGLRRDDMLHDIELDRTAREVIRLCGALRRFSTSKDDRLPELARTLTVPRQVQLIERVQHLPETVAITSLLHAVVESDLDRQSLEKVVRAKSGARLEAELCSLGRRFASSVLPPGRLP